MIRLHQIVYTIYNLNIEQILLFWTITDKLKSAKNIFQRNYSRLFLTKAIPASTTS